MRAWYFSRRVLTALAFIAMTGSAKAAVIDPVDSEKLGTFKIAMADPTVPFSGHALQFAYSSNRTPALAVTIGNPFRVLATTQGKLVLSYGNQIRYTQEVSVEIAEAQNLELVIPQLRVNWAHEELATDIGPMANFTVREPGKSWFYALTVQEPSAKVLSGGLPVVPGAYEFQTFPPSESAQAIATQISWGQSLPVQLASDLFEKRAVLTLAFPEATLPTAAISAGCPQGSVWMTTPNSSGFAYSDSWQPSLVPQAHEQKVRFFPGLKDHRRTYILHAGSMTVPIELEPGQEFTGMFDRIEVGKMKVIREDGTSYITDVDYVIESQQGGRWNRYTHASKDCSGNAQLRAPSGVYVPKGVYRVTLSYRTEEGPKQQVHILDLSK